MPYTYKSKKDGIEIKNIPDNLDPNGPEVGAMLAKARAERDAASQTPQTIPSHLPTNIPMTPSHSPALPAEPAQGPIVEPETTAGGVMGGITRGLAPYAGGAGIGGAIGGPPGALAGAGVAGLSKMVGDPLITNINENFGTNFTTPTEAMNHLLTWLGVEKPDTEAERIVQTASDVAGSAVGGIGLGRALLGNQTLLQQANPTRLQYLGRILSDQPMAQIAGGFGGGAASQYVAERGGGPGAQLVAGLLGGAATGAPFVRRTPVQSTIGAAEQASIAMPERPIVAPLQEAEQAGVRVLTSDIIPPRSFATKFAQATGEKIPYAGTGGIRQAQQSERVEAIRDLFRDYGVGDVTTASSEVMKDLVKKRSEDLTKYSGLKSEVINRLGDQGRVPLQKTIAAIDDQITKLSELKTKEVIPVIDKLEDWKGAIKNQDLKNIELLRRQIGESFKAPEMTASRSIGEKSLNAIYNPLREDMGDFIRENGRPNDFVKWKVANKRLSELTGELEHGALESVLKSGNATPEDVQKMLFSQKPSEVNRLYKNLSANGKQNAKIAVLAKAAEQSGGIGSESPEKFISAVRKLGAPIGVVFDKSEVARIEGLDRVLKLTARAGQASLAPATGVQAVPFIGGALLTDIFGGAGGAVASAATIGSMARAYESAPVRNLLMRMGKTKPGSTEESAIARQVLNAMRAEQATKEKE